MKRASGRVVKPRVVILGGAGAMGRITARDLRKTAPRIETVVADRDLRAARPLEKLGVELVKGDVLSPRSLARALEGATVTIASLPYRFNLAAMRGALAAGSHYVDLGGLFHVTRQQLELHDDFEKAGLCALLGVGSSPGITNLLCVHAAEGLERVTEVHCEVGSVDRTRYRSAPPLGFGYSVDTLLDEFVLPSAVFRGGKFIEVRALDAAERREERFPPPVGKLVLDTTLHSEVATLPLFFEDRGVQEVTFRQGFDAGFADRLKLLVELGLADTKPLEGAPLSPRQVFQRLLLRLPAAEIRGEPDRYEILRAVVRGTKGGKPVTAIADCHAGPRAGWGIGPDIDTGAPPSIAAQMLCTGELEPRPGTWAPEQIIPVAPFFRALEARGMTVSRTVRRDSRKGESARAGARS